MATTTVTGTAGNDSWTIAQPGATVIVDGLGGTDTLFMGTEPRSSFEITLGADGGVHIDTLSGASQPAFYTLYNIEFVVFDNKRDRVDLTTYFSETVPPTASFGTPTPGVATGNLVYTLYFTETVHGLAAADFTASAGSVLAVVGSGATYSVVVAPPASFEGAVTLTLAAGAVTDNAGNANAAALVSAALAVDTRAPTVLGASPAEGATAVAIGSPFTVTFSEAVQRGSGTLTLASAAGATLASVDLATATQVTVSGSTLAVDLSPHLAAGQSYRVSFGAGAVRDAAGNALAAGASFGFATAAVVVPTALVGSAGNDRLVVGSGILSVDGAGGVDTAVFAGAHATHAVTLASGGASVAPVAGGASVVLTAVERIEFADRKLALDLGGAAGQAARTLGLVFGAAAVQQPTLVGAALALLDGGLGYEGLMALAIELRLGANPTSAQVVELLYTSLAGTPPSAAQAAPFVALLDSGALGAAALGVLAADTEINAQHIDLTGLAAAGLPFL